MNGYDQAVQQRIDDHLDAVDAVLAEQGMTRAERGAVTDDIESQVRDMLTARGKADVATVDAVIAQLDPPEKYAQEDLATSQQTTAPLTATQSPPYFSRTAIVGAVWLALFVCLLAAGCAVSIFLGFVGIWEVTLLALMGTAAPLGVTICGVIAISQIRRSCGKLYGLPLAVFEAMLFPLIALDAAIAALTAFCVMLTMRVEMASEMNAPMHSWGSIAMHAAPIAFLLIVIVDYFVIRATWRYASSPIDGPPPAPTPNWFADGTAAVILALTGMASVLLLMRLGPHMMAISLMLLLAAVVCGIAAWSSTRGKSAVCLASVSMVVIVLTTA